MLERSEKRLLSIFTFEAFPEALSKISCASTTVLTTITISSIIFLATTSVAFTLVVYHTKRLLKTNCERMADSFIIVLDSDVVLYYILKISRFPSFSKFCGS